MRLDSQCILCLLKRHSETANRCGNEEQATAFLRDLMRLLCDGPVEMSAPFYTPGITKLFTEHFSLDDDRFAEEKRLSNQYALARFDRIAGMVRSAPDPLYAGLQAAILGNYIDFSALQGEVSFEKLDEMLEILYTIDVDPAQFAKLRADLEQAKELLYLTDNAGEIGFDRVFLEIIRDHFPGLSITVCVRGGNAQNDATREDAAVVGMPFPIIDNGTRIPGTVLEEASEDLKKALETADVVISKGQANVETLLDTGHGYNIYYAFLIKCKRFIDRFGKAKLTPMLVRDGRRKMRRLYVTRPKGFVGALIPYTIFLSYPGVHPEDPDCRWAPGHVMGIPIANGETKNIPLRGERCAVVVNAMTSTGAAGGPAYYIEAGTADIHLEIVTKYSFLNGSRYELRPTK